MGQLMQHEHSQLREIDARTCRAWAQPTYSQAITYNCVLAWQDLAYDEYTSQDRGWAAAARVINYNTDPRWAGGSVSTCAWCSLRRHAWLVGRCTELATSWTTASSVCLVHVW